MISTLYTFHSNFPRIPLFIPVWGHLLVKINIRITRPINWPNNILASLFLFHPFHFDKKIHFSAFKVCVRQQVIMSSFFITAVVSLVLYTWYNDIIITSNNNSSVLKYLNGLTQASLDLNSLSLRQNWQKSCQRDLLAIWRGKIIRRSQDPQM